MDYITVYTEIAVVTIAYAAVLFFNVRSDMGGDWEINIFRALLLCLIVAVMADVVTQAQYRGFLHLNPTLVAFLYGLYMFIFSGVLPFLWFYFVEMRLGGQLLKNRTVIIISIIPLAIMSFMAFASMKTGWFYSVDEYGIYTRGKYWSLQIVVNYIYFLFTTVHAFIVASREPSSIQKKQYYILASFIIAPIIGGFFQLFIGNHPFVAPSISLSMLLVFINIQGSLIHNDSLTGLFNRQSAESYIDEVKATKASKENPYYIYKMRIDEFRSFNYAHGYGEGDEVIRDVAAVLQKVTKKYGAFVARLGGVDFLAIIDGKKLDKLGDYEDAVKEALAKEADKQNLPSDVKVVFGRAEINSADARTAALIHEADFNMQPSTEE